MLTFHFVYQSSRCWNITLRCTYYWVHFELIQCNVRLNFSGNNNKNDSQKCSNFNTFDGTDYKIGNIFTQSPKIKSCNSFWNGEKWWKNRQKKNKKTEKKQTPWKHWNQSRFLSMFSLIIALVWRNTDPMIWSDKKEACNNKYITCILLWITSNESWVWKKKIKWTELTRIPQRLSFRSRHFTSSQD